MDENRIPVAKGISSTDGTTVVDIYSLAADNAICIDDGVGGSDLGPANDKRTDNRKVAFMAVSAVDGVTPVPVYVDATTHCLLVRST